MTASIVIPLILLAFGASFVQRVTGFGFGVFIMTMLPYLTPSYGEATALSGLLAMINAVITGFQMRSYMDWKKMWMLLLIFVAVSTVSITAVSHFESHTLRRALGGFLILISIYFFFFSGKIHIRPTITAQVGIGTLSGLMGGFFAMQGPPAVIFFLSSAESKEQYMVLISAFLAIGNVIMTFFRSTQGFVTAYVGQAWLIAFPAVLLGILLGSKVYKRIPIGTLRKIVYAYMAVAGFILLRVS